MDDPAVVLIHANDANCLPWDRDTRLIKAVLDHIGGETLSLASAANLRHVPTVAVLQTAGWPQWPEALHALKTKWRGTPVIGVLGEDLADSQLLQSALVSELDDFLCAPIREAELRARIDRCLDLTPKFDVPPDLRSFKAQHQLESLLGDSEVFSRSLRKIPLLASVDATVLIAGETGTGKELVARALHYCGYRRNGPFVPCNCGALPDHLFENELFGHVPGAYTDARAEQKGLLAIAEGGTLFLDEVDSLSVNGQVKLLRLLQDKDYRPLGSMQVHHADARILAATNVNLKELVAHSQFRQDLFHRLNVLQITLPPLRERSSDIAVLAQSFLRRFATQLGRPAMMLSAGALQALESYDWPGNVRELESVIQRAAILTESRVIEAEDLELAVVQEPSPPVVAFELAKRQAVGGFERTYLTRLLSEAAGNVSRAAQQAGKDRRTFQRLLRKYDLVAADYHH